MIVANIYIGSNVNIDPSTSINNVRIGDHVRIAKGCSIFGSEEDLLEIGEFSYIGMNSTLNGYGSKLIIGKSVSIAQGVHIMTDSGPNASERLRRIFPIEKGKVIIGDDCWIGAQSILMPNVTLGDFCIVAANSFVNKSYDSYSIIGGSPAKLIRTLTEVEKKILLHD